jgi:hypothetical protein
LDHGFCRAAVGCVTAMLVEYLNSLGNENGFCDIRYNERRGAKHMQRSNSTLHALAISSMTSRWESTRAEYRPRLVVLYERSVSQASACHVAPDMYRSECAPKDQKNVGFNVNDLTDPKVTWPTTTVDRFTVVELALWHALYNNPEDWKPRLYLMGYRIKTGAERKHPGSSTVLLAGFNMALRVVDRC